jgi:hypothetical protein
MESSMIIEQVNGTNGSTIYTDITSALYAMGYILSIEILYLSIFLAVSIAGVIGNAFSVFVFYKPIFYSATSPPLFAYLRYEAVIGLVGNLGIIVYGLNSCVDILPFLNNYPCQWIQAYVAMPLYNMAYYAKFLVEIALVLDRISMLARSSIKSGLSKWLKIDRPAYVMIFICLFTFFINFPFVYLVSAPLTTLLINYGYPGYQVYVFFAAGKTDWSAWGNPGYYPVLAIYIFKNVVTFVIETILSGISLYLYRNHLARSFHLTSPTALIFKRIHKKAKDSSHSHEKSNSSDSSAETAGGKNMANLVLVMCVAGFFHNCVLTSSAVYNWINPSANLVAKILSFCSVFATALRHASNFMLFYSFNKMFKKEALSVFASKKTEIITQTKKNSTLRIQNLVMFLI